MPFVVGDGGPRIGERSPALARQLSAMPINENITLANRYAGQVDSKSVLWVFFGGPPIAFDHGREADLAIQAQTAIETWGGTERLTRCAETVPRPWRCCD